MSSFRQRLGILQQKRPEGKLIWLHVASVGESMVAINFVKKLAKIYPDLQFLITSGTLSSSQILQKSLQYNVYHQFVSLDNILIVKKFLSHWQPNLGIFIESEFWPCLIKQASKQCKLVVFNARLSDKSYKRWQKYKYIFTEITACFQLISTQSNVDLKKYHDLGAINTINLGNLKFTNAKLAVNNEDLKQFQKVLGDRNVFVASSTHAEDEKIILEIISDLKNAGLNYFPIIIPRHPERRNEIGEKCRKLNLAFSYRSRQKILSMSDDVYIVDNFGELGLFYNLAHISFIGGSFKRGGHNVLEPAHFNNVIIVGSDMSNFRDITNQMLKEKAIIQVKNKQGLIEKIKFFTNSDNAQEIYKLQNNAQRFIKNKEKILDKHLEVIKKLI